MSILPILSMKWFKRLGIVLASLLVLAFIAVFIFLHTVDFSASDEEIASTFAQSGYTPVDTTVTFGERVVRYVEVGDPKKPLVVFVHGSPGSWDAFLHLMGNAELLAQYRMISVDRLGYAGSRKGGYEGSVEVQAAAIAEVIRLRSPNQPVVLVGHSYGGPVIARIAMDFPERTHALVSVAGSIAPDLEQTKWFQIPARWPFIRPLLPNDLDVCNMEILALKPELERMMPLWEGIQAAVTIIQGGQDTLVPPGNADFAEKMLINAPLDMVQEAQMNHFVLWNQPDLLINAILQYAPDAA